MCWTDIHTLTLAFLELPSESKRYIYSGGAAEGRPSLNTILEFNYETESWTEIGTMKEKRINHAVSVVSYDDYAKWCNSEAEKTTEPPR